MTPLVSTAAESVVAACRKIATLTDEPGRTTRTFLSPAAKQVHAFLSERMRAARLTVSTDYVGNLIGHSTVGRRRRVLIGSHLDTVPNAGAFDGVLGVMIGIALASKYPVDVVGFSEEEGVRFGRPFIGSRGFTGTLDESWMNLRDAANLSLRDAIRAYGLASYRPELPDVYMEFHIEQGPVLDALNLPLGVVRSIAGQSRLSLTLQGNANHAGTTPMHLRTDALAGAAEWICTVERTAREYDGLVATVGRVEVLPNAGNVIPGEAVLSLDVRHEEDSVRHAAVDAILSEAQRISLRRHLKLSVEKKLDQPAVALDGALTDALAAAVSASGYPIQYMTSGAGHDAMIMAGMVPSAMLFLRSPRGISHHPDEDVRVEDVSAALDTGSRFIEALVNV